MDDANIQVEETAVKKEACFIYCSVCEEVVSNNQLFLCKTCAAENSENENDELICDNCIFFHSWKGHSISHSNGQETVICSKHKQPSLDFCSTCEVTICCKCLRFHAVHQHEIRSLDNVVAEIKGKVCKIESQFAEMEDQSSAGNIFSVILADATYLTSTLEARIQQFQKRLDDVQPEINMLKLSENLLNEHNEKLEVLKKDLVSVKNASDSGTLVLYPKLKTKFTEIKDERIEIRKRREKFEIFFQNITTSLLEHGGLSTKGSNFSAAGTKIEQKLSQTREPRAMLQKLYVGCYLQPFFELTSDGYSITVQKCCYTEDGRLSKKFYCKKMRKEQYCEIEKAYLMLYHKARIVILMKDRTMTVLDIADLKFKNGGDYPIYEELLMPYSNTKGRGQLLWAYYDTERKLIKFSHNTLFEIPCDTKPVAKSNVASNICFFFNSKAKDLIYVDTIAQKYEYIPYFVHRVDEADCVSNPYNDQEIMIWEKKTKRLVILRKPHMRWNFSKWKVSETVTWIEDLSFFRGVVHSDLKFLPAIICSEGNDGENNGCSSTSSEACKKNFVFLVSPEYGPKI